MHGVARVLKLKRFAIAGNSLGGHAARRYAIKHPERVTKLILVYERVARLIPVYASGFPLRASGASLSLSR